VGRLTRRLEMLERKYRPPRRCGTCRDWSDCRVVHLDAGMEALATSWAEKDDLPQPPERCPDCGWEPATVTVQYVDDWRPR
jgi:hypothetical protein